MRCSVPLESPTPDMQRKACAQNSRLEIKGDRGVRTGSRGQVSDLPGVSEYQGQRVYLADCQGEGGAPTASGGGEG